MLKRTPVLFTAKFAAIMSGYPSPLISAAATQYGFEPVE